MKCSHKTIEFTYDNKAYETNKKEEIRVARVVRSRELVDKILNTKTVFQLLLNSVSNHPNRPFLGSHSTPTAPYSWMTYKEVYGKVLNAGSGLLQFPKINIKSGSCIGLFAANCPEWLITEIGCWAYGLVAVPLYDTLGIDALKHICNETELSVVICDTPKRAERLIENLPYIPTLQHIVILNPNVELEALRTKADRDLEILSFDELLARGTAIPLEPQPYDEDGLIVICYTSGTTGTPKGAMIRNSTMIAVIASTQAALGNLIGLEDVMLSFLPLAHIYEQFNEVYILYCGARVGFYSGNIMNLRDDMQVLKPTIFTAVPRLLYRIYDATYAAVAGSKVKKSLLNWAMTHKCKNVDKQIYRKNGFADSIIFDKIRMQFGGHIRVVLISSAPISPPVLRFTRSVFSCPVLEGYGCTESCGPMCMSVGGDLGNGHVGAPLPFLQVKLVDVPEMGIVASRDKKGEICAKGKSCIQGYYKQPEKTAELIDKDGWMHTGDIGVWNNDSLKIVDRSKQIFKLSQGEYVAPEKVEMAYRESSLVQQVFVDGDTLCSFPVAIVVPEPVFLHRLLMMKKKMANGEESKKLPSKNKTSSAAGDEADGAVPSLEDLCKDPESKSAILADFKHLGEAADLKGFEKVKNIYLLAEPFSIENGLLTPTLKSARPMIRTRYANELAQLYEDEKAGTFVKA